MDTSIVHSLECVLVAPTFTLYSTASIYTSALTPLAVHLHSRIHIFTERSLERGLDYRFELPLY